MTHPREPVHLPMDRRQFLRVTAMGVPVAAAILTACSQSSPSSAVTPAPGIPLARQDHPVHLPLFEDLPPIANGLSPETHASLRIYGWGPSYISPHLIREFENTYECSIDFVPFRQMDDAVAHLRTGLFEADLFFPTLKVLGALASARVLQPLNHSYIPNLSQNVWQSLESPFYDLGSRYTVPYFVWTTGIAWRNDLVTADIPAMNDPYDVFWDPAYRGHVHVLDSVQDLIGMALLHEGIDDVNTEDPRLIEQAKNALLDMVDAVAPQIDSTDYRDLFTGGAQVHQSWSGNISFARHFAPKPSDITKLSYWWPPQGHAGAPGLIGSDTLAVLAGAKSPVLAHHFINFILDAENAYTNSAYNGYQAPVRSVTAGRLVAEDAVPENLHNIIVTQEDFALGKEELELSPAADALWHQVYDEVLAAAGH